MGAKIEYKVAIVRAGESFEKHKDPYDFVCYLSIDGNKAHITAAAGTYTKATRDAIKAELKAHGIEEVTWERLNNKPRKIKRVR